MYLFIYFFNGEKNDYKSLSKKKKQKLIRKMYFLGMFVFERLKKEHR